MKPTPLWLECASGGGGGRYRTKGGFFPLILLLLLHLSLSPRPSDQARRYSSPSDGGFYSAAR